MTTELSVQQVGTQAQRILSEVERAVIGKRSVLELTLTALLARGHVLFEDLPGLAKTLIARSFAEVVGMSFRRVQFTPDLMPSDVTGSSVYDPRRQELFFRPGPIFANLVLGDEINRAPPKTQSALLEAMAEQQVTVEGETRVLSDPFLVVATQNPIEFEGTYPLPEAQLDRFLIRLSVGYPTKEEERELLERRIARQRPNVELHRQVDLETFIAMQNAVEQVHVASAITNYVVELVEATRLHPSVEIGASPRASLALVHAARAVAVLEGRDFVLPEDVQRLAAACLSHRVQLRAELWLRGQRTDDIVGECLDKVQAPSVEDLRGDEEVVLPGRIP